MGRCLGSIGETCMTREGISFKIREGDRVIDACCDGEGEVSDYVPGGKGAV